MNLGPLEILVILVLALVVFGPKRLPEVGRQVAGVLRDLRQMQNTVRSEINAAMREEPEPGPRAAPRPPAEPGAATGPEAGPEADAEADHDSARGPSAPGAADETGR